MTVIAQISITTGPDRGKVFDVDEELVHIGGGAENQVALLDSTLAEHQASIVSRHGRCAIYTPLDEAVAVDGNTIPAQRWVWLPDRARVRLSGRTTFQFTYAAAEGTAAEGTESDLPSGPPVGPSAPLAASAPPAEISPAAQVAATSGRPARSDQHDALAGRTGTAAAATQTAAPARSKPSRPDKPPRPAGRGEKSAPHVARFIVDRAGEAAVQLGEDGQLPELKLSEAAERKPAVSRERGSNPLVLYLALAFSFVASIALLLIDVEPAQHRTLDKHQARLQLEDYYRTKNGELQPYQRHLREARLAHSRRDYEAERRAYRRVLDLLASEDVNRFTGLTGSLERDRRLRELIAIVMPD